MRAMCEMAMAFHVEQYGCRGAPGSGRDAEAITTGS